MYVQQVLATYLYIHATALRSITPLIPEVDAVGIRGQLPSSLREKVLSEVSNRVLFGGWEIFFFYHHVRRRVRCGSFVCLFVIFLFVRVTI
jgi:hypothetical protein